MRFIFCLTSSHDSSFTLSLSGQSFIFHLCVIYVYKLQLGLTNWRFGAKQSGDYLISKSLATFGELHCMVRFMDSVG